MWLRLVLAALLLPTIGCISSDQESSVPLLCVVVPFRDGCGWAGQDRTDQLLWFLQYMTEWLTARGHASFHFVVSEQSQRGLFNKGVLFNVGALQAFALGCEHVVFHDVDQLPDNPANDYVYPGEPLHQCTWSTQFGGERPGSNGDNTRTIPMQPHVGGAVMMSKADYIEVNGFSNGYLRWGLEDSDMFQRLEMTFGRFARLPQEVGTYHDQEHARVPDEVHQNQPEWGLSSARFQYMQRQDAHARRQMLADGLQQVCSAARVIGVWRDPLRRLTMLTSDLLPPHASACSDAPPNRDKLFVEAALRRNRTMHHQCAALLRPVSPPPTLERRLCSGSSQFCIDALTSDAIRASVAIFDSTAILDDPPPDLAPQRAGLRRFADWAQAVTPEMEAPFEAGPAPPVGHGSMMGWNESAAYMRMLVRAQAPFSLVQYGSAELAVLDAGAEEEEEEEEEVWDADPARRSAESLPALLLLPLQAAQAAEALVMVGLPVMSCHEGFAEGDFRRGGGGRASLRDAFVRDRFELLELGRIPSNRFAYAFPFGNLNYNATLGLLATLRQAQWPILVVTDDATAGPGRTVDSELADAVLTLPAELLRGNVLSSAELAELTAQAQQLAEGVNGTAVLFNLGVLSNAFIGVMHRANPRNTYLNVGKALDLALWGMRSEEYHPTADDASHFVRAGGALQDGQTCTEVRWTMHPGELVPTP